MKNAAARETNFRLASRKLRPRVRVKGPVSEKFFRLSFRFDWPQWLSPRAVRQDLGVMQPCVCASTTQVVECSTSKELPFVSLVAWSPRLSFTLCERISQWTEQTDRVN